MAADGRRRWGVIPHRGGLCSVGLVFSDLYILGGLGIQVYASTYSVYIQRG